MLHIQCIENYRGTYKEPKENISFQNYNDIKLSKYRSRSNANIEMISTLKAIMKKKTW